MAKTLRRNKVRIGELELPIFVDKAIETILTNGIETQIVLKPITSEYDMDLPFNEILTIDQLFELLSITVVITRFLEANNYANFTFYFRLIQPSSVKVIKLH